MQGQSLLVFLLSICPCWSHVEPEYDYWARMQSYTDRSARYNKSIIWQTQFMIPPGGKCNLEKHHEAYIQHHLIRHSFLDVTKRGFIAILNNMCAYIPSFHIKDFTQLYQCVEGHCSCPFEFLTWEEAKCKIRVGYPCGDVSLMPDRTISLNHIFGCATGSICFKEPEGTTTINDTTTVTNSSPQNAVCKCRHSSRHESPCVTERKMPPFTVYHPPPEESAADQLSPLPFTPFIILSFQANLFLK